MKIHGFLFWCFTTTVFAPICVGQQAAPVIAVHATRPVAFVPNLGQWPDAARFRARIGGTAAFFERDGWTLLGHATGDAARGDRVRAVALRLSFGDGEGSGPRGTAELATRHHYFLGRDASAWRSHVPCFGEVHYARAVPGIDVRVYPADGHFAFDVHVAADAAVDAFAMRVAGARGMQLDASGRLRLATELGDVQLTAPIAWEEAGAERRPIASRFVLRGDDTFSFAVGVRTPGRRLVIDPGIVWSAAIGGSSTERAEACATDAADFVCVGGSTWSPDFPVTVGAFDTTYGIEDAFVSRLAPTGAVQFTTFLGGAVSQFPGPFGASPWDEVRGIAVDAQSHVFVTGTTMATDFPTTPGVFRGTAPVGGTNVFVTRLAANGASLDFSTHVWLGQSRAIAVDAQGQSIVVGNTTNPFWPITAGALSSSYSGTANEGFVTRVGPTGAWLSYSTYLGGSSYDEPSAVAIDAQGRVAVAGSTQSNNFPTTTNAYDRTYNSASAPWDAFVLRFAPNLAGLDYGSYLGGIDNEFANALAIDAQGEVVVTGWTLSANFPTTPGAHQTTFGAFGAEQVFVTRFAGTGASLVASTFFGGSGGEIANGCALDARGDVTIVGNAGATGFPLTPGAPDTTFDGGYNDAFLTRLRGDLTRVVHSTYLPGSGNEDIATAVSLGRHGQANVVGIRAFDAFVAACDVLPIGATAYGAASPGCRGAQWIGVDSMPRLGNSGFTITLGNALPNGFGLLLFTGAGQTQPLSIGGIDAWVDLGTSITSLTVVADAGGRVDWPLPIPNAPNLVALALYAQFAWLEPTGPAPCPAAGLSASNALALVIQP